jgi:hypothetical protein
VRFAGVVGEHEPDPRLRWREQARLLPVPIVGLVSQPHLEDWDAIGVGSGTRNGVLDWCEASVSYTLWRNPDELDDPVNLAEMDEQQRRALEVAPGWPRPPWLVEQVRRMRYPVLWECVRTQWSRAPGVFRIDTDPQVYGLAVALDARTLLTAAIPRDALPYLRLAFAKRPV